MPIAKKVGTIDRRVTRAWYCKSGRLSLTSNTVSPPDSNEVEVAVASVGLCRTDLLAIAGKIQTPSDFVPCHEFSGRVTSCGDNIDKFDIGDRVVVNPVTTCGQCQYCVHGSNHLCAFSTLIGVDSDGACREKLVLPASKVFPISDSLSDHQAVFAEPLAATLAIFNAKIERQQQGLVLGSGRIAELAIRALDVKGFGNVSSVAIDKAHGLPSNQFDFIIETDASTEMFKQMVRLVKPHGQLIFKSRQTRPVSLNFREVVTKQPCIQFVHYGCFGEAVKILSSGDIYVQDLVGEIFEFDRFEDALSHAKRNEDRKTIVAIGSC